MNGKLSFSLCYDGWTRHISTGQLLDTNLFVWHNNKIMPQKFCKICSKEFHIKPSHLKLGYGKYCSLVCRRRGQLKGRFVICEICNKEVWRTPKALRHSKSKKYFCSKSCQTQWRNKEFTGEKHPNWQGGEFIYQRVMRDHQIPAKCSGCGITNKKVLIVHHKDHNRKNSDISNLTWLCRNCHYLIHDGKTF